MLNFETLENANNVENTVGGGNVMEKSVAKPFTLRSSFDQAWDMTKLTQGESNIRGSS
jgi:hypothetical protein